MNRIQGGIHFHSAFVRACLRIEPTKLQGAWRRKEMVSSRGVEMQIMQITHLWMLPKCQRSFRQFWLAVLDFDWRLASCSV